MKLTAPKGVNSITGTVNAFHVCWNLINDQDVFQDQSGYDVSQRTHFYDYYQEAFDEYAEKGKDGLDGFWDKWRWRTDVSDDMRFEFESEEDRLGQMLNIYDNLKTQGVV